MQKEFKLSYNVFMPRMTSQSCVFILQLTSSSLLVRVYIEISPSPASPFPELQRHLDVSWTQGRSLHSVVGVCGSLGSISSKSLLSPTFTGLFCCLGSFNSSGEFCPFSKLERRGRMMPGFAKWYFTGPQPALTARECKVQL